MITLKMVNYGKNTEESSRFLVEYQGKRIGDFLLTPKDVIFIPKQDSDITYNIHFMSTLTPMMKELFSDKDYFLHEGS